MLVALAHAFASTPSNSVNLVSGDIKDHKPVDVDTDDESDGDVITGNDDIVTSMDSDQITEELSLSELIENVKEKVPHESIKLQSKKLPKEKVNEYAVIAVKRAFSQCPSLDILIEALLNNPIFEIYKVCKLIPGMPVAPMLAKPTKVLINLN